MSHSSQARQPRYGALLATLAVMYFARDVLVPVALAILFSFLLSPQVRHLERRKIPRGPAVVLVTGVFFCLFSLVTWMTVRQVIDLAAKIPAYQSNIQGKLDSLRGQGGTLQAAANVLTHVNQEASAVSKGADGRPAPARPQPPGAGEPGKPPLDVRVVEPPVSPPQFLRNLIGPLLGPLGTAGVVIIFTLFMLIEREKLRDRLLHLAGPEHLPITTQAINEAGERISRYLQAEVAINLSMGVAVATGLFFLHVPNAALWGLLAAIFRFVPYVGYWLSALAPLALAMAAFHSWWPVALTAALFLVLEVVASNFVEPWIYGASTGLSPVAVVVAATFWTWMWGGVGLLLSTPLTVCIVVLGRYVPKLSFLHTLLGDEEVVPFNARFYQRLLAFDQEEVSELTETCLATQTYAAFYDDVVIPALNQAQLDARRFNLTEDRQQFIRVTLRALVEDLRDRPEAVPASTEGAAVAAAKTPVEAVPLPAPTSSAPLETQIIILPVKTEADEIAGLFLGHVLTAAKVGNDVLPYQTEVDETIDIIKKRQIPCVLLSAVRPFAVMQLRRYAKHLRSAAPGVKIMVGLWDAKRNTETTCRNLQSVNADWVGSTLAEAVAQFCPTNQCEPAEAPSSDD